MKTKLLFCLLLILGTCIKRAGAQNTCTWVGGTTGSWANTSNWNITTLGTGVSYPANSAANDIVAINTSTNITISSPLPQGTVYQIIVGNGAIVTITFAGTASTMGVSNAITIGSSSTSSLTIAGTGSITGASAVTINTAGTLTTNSGISFTAATMQLKTSSTLAANATFGGKVTFTGQIQTPNSAGTATLITNGSNNTFSGGFYVHNSTILNWNGTGTSSCSGGDVSSGATIDFGAGNTVNFTGSCELHAVSPAIGTLINSGALTFANCSLFSDNLSSGSPTVITNNSGANISVSGALGQISLGALTSMSNTGTITCTASTNINTGSSSVITNNSGGTMSLTGATITLAASAILNNSGSLSAVSSSTINVNSNPATFNNYGTLTITSSTLSATGASPVITNSGTITATTLTANLSGNGLSFTNTGAINASATSVFTFSGNPQSFSNTYPAVFALDASKITITSNSCGVVNSGTISQVNSSTFTTGNSAAPFTNSGIFTSTSSAINFSSGSSGSYTNSGNFTAVSSPITFGGGTATLTNSGNFSATGSNISIPANSSAITNSGNFTADGSTITYAGTSGAINNTGNFKAINASNISMPGNTSAIKNSGGTFTGTSINISLGFGSSIQNSGSAIVNFSGVAVNTSQTGFISNTSSGAFTANGGSSIYLADQAYITNTGTFNAGSTANSSCTITTTAAQGGSKTVISNTGTFNVGSTSSITMNNTNTQTITVANTSPGVFTLQSDKYGSATIGQTSSTSTSYTGVFNVQRYVPGQASGTIADNTRSYRLLSSPVNVNSTPVINNTGATAYGNLQYLSTNSGGITGAFTAGPTGAADGFSVTNATPTIYLYNESITPSNATFNGGNFKGITNISVNGNSNLPYYTGVGTTTGTTTLYAGNGFLIYYTGNNTANLTSGTALNKQFRFGGNYGAVDASTMTAIGTLNQGNVPVRLWWQNTLTTLSDAKTSYNLAGNPYASTIDWNTTLTGGISFVGPATKTIYEFNYSNRNYGVYQASVGGTTGTNNSSHLIASGQGFFVVANASTNTLTFTEAAKTTTQPASQGSTYLLMGAPVAVAKTQLLRVRVAKDTVNTDDIMVQFEPAAKNGYEKYYDADRRNGVGNVATLASYSSDSTNLLSINHMHSIDSTTRIKLYVNVLNSAGADTLSGSGFETIDPRYNVYLLDHYKNDSLFFSKYKQYLFNINSADTNSFGANRFEIVFRKKASLAYHLLSFKAAPVKEGVLLTWKTENELDLTGFQLQRQDGSKVFIPLSSMQSDSSGVYNYTDKTPLAGTNYYRLQQDDAYGEISYSNIVSVNINKTGSGQLTQAIALYPNPVLSSFNITINTNPPPQVILTVTNALGQVLINRTTGSEGIQQAANNLLPGSYTVQLVDSASKQVIGTTKFIKQ